MDSGMEVKKIDELKGLKNQLRWWRYGLFFTALFVVWVAISTVKTAAANLIEKGPAQEKFVAELTEGMKNDVAPMVESMARDTIREVQPEIKAAFDDVNNQLPHLAQASLAELDKLQENLPKRGEVVLERTFAQMLVQKEDQLHEMFPEATDEQIERLLTNLTESSGEEASSAAVELFGSHFEVLQNIHANLEIISDKEAKYLVGVDPNWEMGLAVLDLFRDEFHAHRPDQGAPAAQMASNEPKANKTKSPMKTERDDMKSAIKVSKK